MAGGRFIGFDPDRMATLSTATAGALDHLRRIISSDPAAAAAMTRVGNVRFELETVWLPAIARVTGDRSMAGWDGDEPEPPPTAWDLIVGSDEPPPPQPTGPAITPGDYLRQDHHYLVDRLLPPPPMVPSGDEWESLEDWEQTWLIVNRPDAVLTFVLKYGVALTPEQLDLLDEGNAFVEFSDAFLTKFGLEVGVKWFAVELGGEAELIVMRMSDGTVHVMVAEKGTFGVSVDVGDIEIGAGIYAKTGQTLVFQSEEEAEEAIETLIAASDQAWWEGPVDFVASGWPASLFVDQRSDVQKKVDELWDEYGEEETEEVGVYVSAHAELAGALDLEGDASVEAGTYSTTDGDGNVTQQGVIVTGSISGSASQNGGGATVTAEGSFVVDAYQETATGDEFVTITLTAGGASGITAELIDMAGAGLSVAAVATTSTVVTTTITIPVTDETIDDVVDVVTGLATGSLPSDALGALYSDADITVAVDQVTSASESVEIDGGAVEADASVTVTHGENVGTWHKPPGGGMYSQNELDAAIEAARQAGPSAEPRAGGGTKTW